MARGSECEAAGRRFARLIFKSASRRTNFLERSRASSPSRTLEISGGQMREVGFGGSRDMVRAR